MCVNQRIVVNVLLRCCQKVVRLSCIFTMSANFILLNPFHHGSWFVGQGHGLVPVSKPLPESIMKTVACQTLLLAEITLFVLVTHIWFEKCAATCLGNGLSPFPWWRHQMETFSGLLAFCVGNSPVTGEFPSQRPVTQSFDVFFELPWTNG